MTHQVYAFEPPERFVAGTVGAPGERTFFLQARGGGRLVSVALEKVQVSLLAEKLEELLDRGAPPLRRRAARRRPPADRQRAAGHARRRGVPGRHARAGLRRRHRHRGHRGDRGGRGRGRARPRPSRGRGRRGRRRPRPAAGPADAAGDPRVHRPGPAGASPPAGRRARSAASRSTRAGTSARGTTATTGDASTGVRRRRCSRDATRCGCCADGDARARGPAGRRVQHHAAGVRDPRRRRPPRCVYKPVRGERPLWDFPDGTLAGREVARVPGLRGDRLGRWCRRRCCATARSARAPASCGSTSRTTPSRWSASCPARRAADRLAADRRRRATTTATRTSLAHADDPRLARLAVFDAVINNADRKGGHVLLGAGRPGVRRRPRRVLPRRGQAAHGAVGLGRRAAARRTRARCSTALRARPATARSGAALREHLTARRGRRDVRARVDRLLRHRRASRARRRTGRRCPGRRSDVIGCHARSLRPSRRAWLGWRHGVLDRRTTCPRCPGTGRAARAVRLGAGAASTRPAGRRRRRCTSAASPRTTPPTSATPPP